MKKILTCSAATLSYWALLFLGPALILLLNNIGYYFSGGGWGPGSFMYNVLSFFSQPLSCFLAYAAAKGICKESHKICVLINCIVGIGMTILSAIGASNAGNTKLLISMIISTIVCTITAVIEAVEIKRKS